MKQAQRVSNRKRGAGFFGTLITAALMALFAPSAFAERVRVVATTGMVADLARAVGGDRVEVDQLMGSGVDPHLYKPVRSDIARLSRADLVLYNGLMLEGKMADAFARVGATGRKVVAVAESLARESLLAPEDFEGNPDPHVWMDPSLWAGTVAVVRDALTEVDPEGAAVFAENARAYEESLVELHEYAARVLSSVPESRRVLVTAHDAFNYLGRRYGIEVVGIQGLSTESEAGVRDIQRIVDLLVDRDLPAVFVETTVADRNVRALIAGAKSRGHEVRIGGNLFSDAMGDAGMYEGTYIGMIDHNVTAIARALGGTAPEGGMRGRLAQTR